MRFLLGICSGMVLLLVLAGEEAGLDRGGAPAQRLRGVVPGFLERVGRSEASAVDPAAPAVEGVSDSAAPQEPAADPPSEERLALWPDDAPLPEAFGDAYAWWAQDGKLPISAQGSDVEVEADAPQSPVPRASAEEAAVSAVEGAEPPPATIPEAPLLAGPASPSRAEETSAPDAQVAARTASVWIPFHSERSASGFAQRLSRALEHPFDVRREGPGRYQVVFPYDDADSRDEVLARVAMLTGTQQ